MSREVRRVPATWEHPTRDSGRYKPLYDGDFAKRAREWMDEAIAWDAGTHRNAAEYKTEYPYFWQWEGMPPNEEDYMPSWPDAERTHYMMYETTSEGTPISPALESPELLARWLADHGANSFGSSTATYEQWLGVCRGGWAPSAVIVDGRFMSGVEALSESVPPTPGARD